MVAPAMALNSMVATSSKTRRPLGNPARSPPRMPRELWPIDLGGTAMLSRSWSACSVPVFVVLESGDHGRRDSRQQDRSQIGARLGIGSQVGEHTGVEAGEQR